MGPWIVEFHKILEDKGINKECVYNADNTGMFYHKLPNTLYIKN